jgi:hypothetical protein
MVGLEANTWLALSVVLLAFSGWGLLHWDRRRAFAWQAG